MRRNRKHDWHFFVHIQLQNEKKKNNSVLSHVLSGRGSGGKTDIWVSDGIWYACGSSWLCIKVPLGQDLTPKLLLTAGIRDLA